MAEDDAAIGSAEAAGRFEKIVNGGAARLYYPVEFVRGFYSLGQIADRQGVRAKAGASYRRFLQYWADGDIDRDRVADARQRLGRIE